MRIILYIVVEIIFFILKHFIYEKIIANIYLSIYLMIGIPTFAQFQNSSLPERQIPLTTPYHIRDMTCHSYGELRFTDNISDLYISINTEGTAGIHYKRTLAGDPSTIIDEGIEMIPGASLVKDAVIVSNPINGSSNPYAIAAIYTTDNGANITFYEWTLSGINQILDYQFTNLAVYNMKMDAMANDAVPDPMGNGYRIIDFDEQLMPYIPTLAFSGNNRTINNLYTVFASSYDYTYPVPEAVYDKHPEWGNIPNQGYRPLGVQQIDQGFKATIYPNPFTHYLMINILDAYQQEDINLQVTDIIGRTVLHTQGKVQALNIQLKEQSIDWPSSQLYHITLTLNSTQASVSYKIMKK